MEATLNPNEAPSGYVASVKPAYRHETGNICRQCDWRKNCQDPATDFNAPGHRCMSYSRQDGVGVIFIRHNARAVTPGANETNLK